MKRAALLLLLLLLPLAGCGFVLDQTFQAMDRADERYYRKANEADRDARCELERVESWTSGNSSGADLEERAARIHEGVRRAYGALEDLQAAATAARQLRKETEKRAGRPLENEKRKGVGAFLDDLDGYDWRVCR